jgi:hypothetical protein
MVGANDMAYKLRATVNVSSRNVANVIDNPPLLKSNTICTWPEPEPAFMCIPTSFSCTRSYKGNKETAKAGVDKVSLGGGGLLAAFALLFVINFFRQAPVLL